MKNSEEKESIAFERRKDWLIRLEIAFLLRYLLSSQENSIRFWQTIGRAAKKTIQTVKRIGKQRVGDPAAFLISYSDRRRLGAKSEVLKRKTAVIRIESATLPHVSFSLQKYEALVLLVLVWFEKAPSAFQKADRWQEKWMMMEEEEEEQHRLMDCLALQTTIFCFLKREASHWQSWRAFLGP